MLIKFKGKRYYLIGDLESGGAIATKDQYENGECSYAHLYENGDIMRFREKIGERKDIEVISKNLDIKPKPDAFLGLLGDTWPRY